MASRVAEIAREEAERVEAETPDAPPDETPAPDAPDVPEPDAPEPQPQPEAITPEKVEALFASLRREDERHTREVEKRAGPMYADLAPCPACGPTAGFVFSALPPHEVDGVLERVRAAFGMDTDAVLEYADDKQECPKCKGYGRTLTHSKVDTQRALPCGGCNGQGWINVLQPLAPVQTFPPLQPTPNLVAPQQVPPNATTDPWNRPIGHPHYGLAPESVGV